MRTIFAVAYFWVLAIALSLVGLRFHAYIEIPIAIVCAIFASSYLLLRNHE